jgi:Zn-dependent protease with chaperone function
MTAQVQGAGLYYDGKTGAPQSVTVKLENSAVAILSPDGTPLARWDYTATEQMPSMADRLRLALAEDGSTARLEVRDPAFAEAIKQQLGFGTPQHQAKERRQRQLVVVWSAAAVGAVLAIAVAGLPAIAELLTPLVSIQMESRIGNAVHELELAQQKAVKGGPLECGNQGDRERAGKAAFDKLFAPLEAASNLPVPVRVLILRTATINATAFPGGILHFHHGLIAYMESPEELAGVMAHELGHIVHRHGLRGYLHDVGLTFLVAMALGDVFTATGVFVATHGDLSRRNTRAQEHQADVHEVQLLNKLGADTHASANFWDRLVRLEKEAARGPRRFPLLSETHPGHAERAAYIRSAPKVANPKPLLTKEEWQTLREVCSGK